MIQVKISRYKECDEEKVPNPKIDFTKVRQINDWFYWLKNTVKPNVRVQEWYNGKPPYGLRGYLDDKSNRIIGYAIGKKNTCALKIYDEYNCNNGSSITPINLFLSNSSSNQRSLWNL